MKLNRRKIVMLLNALVVQQDMFAKDDPKAPRGADFKDFALGYEITKQEDAENPYVYYKEFNDLFSELIYYHLHELSPEEEELLRRPPTEVM